MPGGFLDWFLPAACIACDAGLDPTVLGSGALAPLCSQCSDDLEPIDPARRCERCGHPAGAATPDCEQCVTLPRTFSRAVGVFRYQSPAGEIVRRLKYRRRPWAADVLADLCLHHAGPEIEELARGCAVAPVPMHWWREVQRGYNQADLFARAMATRLSLPYLDPGPLVRVRRAKPQARFHAAAERRDNLAGVFAVKRPGLVQGRAVLLVDDVMTTGWTMATVAGLLQEAGATEVRLFAAIRAALGEQPDDREERLLQAGPTSPRRE